MSQPLLSVRGLRVQFHARGTTSTAVDGLDLDVHPGETLGLVGESGSGKTVTMLAALGLLPPPPSCTVTGQVLYAGQDLLRMSRSALRSLRGRDIGTVFQDPMTSLHPSLRVVDQVAEVLLVHDRRLSQREALARACTLLERVGIPHPDRRAREYPHQWSGGMRQRAMIAMAIANGPRLLVADEPTTALDVTIQAQVLDVLRDARDELGAATVFITHDLGVVAELADHVVVLHHGQVAERATVQDLFEAPRHPHTIALLRALPRIDGSAPQRAAPPRRPPVLHVSDLVVEHDRPGRTPLRAVDGVSLSLHPGETLALVGESGCGKSTLARALLRLVDSRSGSLRFRDSDITTAGGRGLRPLRRQVSMVFQDPYASLNPRMTAAACIAQPMRIAGTFRSAGGRRRVLELLDLVGLPAGSADRLPAEFSGGQRQRIAIARALALGPEVLVLDEPVSSLDVVVQAQVVQLLERLQVELGLAYLFISHDLALVRALSDRVAVMYLGRIVETGTTEQVYARSTHPYTQSLLSAVPVPAPGRRPGERIVLSGDLPDPAAPPSGCRFHTRCWAAQEVCSQGPPPELRLRDGSDHPTACLFATPRAATWSPQVDHL
jgi:peptide/nickel transport system ATP-binding protein